MSLTMALYVITSAGFTLKSKFVVDWKSPNPVHQLHCVFAKEWDRNGETMYSFFLSLTTFTIPRLHTFREFGLH